MGFLATCRTVVVTRKQNVKTDVVVNTFAVYYAVHKQLQTRVIIVYRTYFVVLVKFYPRLFSTKDGCPCPSASPHNKLGH